MIITTEQYKKILTAGGYLVIDGAAMPSSQMLELANALSGSRGKLQIKNLQNLTFNHLIQLASIASGQIIFDLT